MTDLLVEEKHMTRDDASAAVDLDITQLVNGNVGVHARCPKNIFSTNSTKQDFVPAAANPSLIDQAKP